MPHHAVAPVACAVVAVSTAGSGQRLARAACASSLARQLEKATTTYPSASTRNDYIYYSSVQGATACLGVTARHVAMSSLVV